MVKHATAKLRSKSGYVQGRKVTVPKLPKELPDDYEERTWKHRAHLNRDGHVIIPSMQFANSIKEAAKFSGVQIEGRGKERWTKHFESGIIVMESLDTGVHIDDVEKFSLYVPSDGRVGGSTRVTRHFPMIHEWDGEVTYSILDDIITPEVFADMLVTSGELIGVGSFRPRNRGILGRFGVESIEWRDIPHHKEVPITYVS